MLICNIFKRLYSKTSFVPKHFSVNDKDVEQLKSFIREHNKIIVITGAGISTESGIPDYRSAEVGLYARNNHKPIQYLDFLKSEKTRQRYWARNYVGWERFSSRQPNETHFAIKNLEQSYKKILTTITQNVDSLHFKAGSKEIIELHGSAFRVLCLRCNNLYDRHYIQEMLKQHNPDMQETNHFIRPDGDVDLPQEKVEGFNPPKCESCGDILKPDIVFFGDNVPIKRVDRIKKLVTASDSMLILGSSLSVYSAYRFVLQAVEEGKKIIIVNIGPTRADKYAHLKISVNCSDILKWLC